MKNIFQHWATPWDFCVILMGKDSIFSPAERADFRRKEICANLRSLRENSSLITDHCSLKNRTFAP